MNTCIAFIMYFQRLFCCLLVNNIVFKQISMTSLMGVTKIKGIYKICGLIHISFQDMSVESADKEEEEEEEEKHHSAS